MHPSQKLELRQRMLAANPNAFNSLEDVGAFLDRVDTPASFRWSLAINPKCACTTVKRMLFELEFGVPLTAHYLSLFDINGDSSAHRLSMAGVFRPLHALAEAEAILSSSLRVTTARHPVSRAASMFLYLCQSNRDGHTMFVGDRLRLNALTGFDWDKDPGTPKGFAKFLDYIGQSFDKQPSDRVDFHFRRQVDTVRPDVFRPDLIGMVGELDRFWVALQQRLAPDMPVKNHASHSNSTSSQDRKLALLDPSNLQKIATLYEADFSWLGLDVESWHRPRQTVKPALRWTFPILRKARA